MFTIATCGLKLPHSNWRGAFYVHWHTQTCTWYHSLKETSRKHDIGACQVWWTRLSPSQVWPYEKPVLVLTQQPSPPTATIPSVLMEKCKSVLLMNACGCQHCVLCPGPTLVGKSYENGSQKKLRGFLSLKNLWCSGQTAKCELIGQYPPPPHSDLKIPLPSCGRS